MNPDRPHYYDGKPYEILFDRALKEVRDIIVEKIERDSAVVDIACGTGSLVFDLAGKCESITGVELSSKMIDYAEQRRQNIGINNVNFAHADATNLADFQEQQFDYATISMAIHEMPPEIRVQVLKELKRVARRVIIADYATPLPFTFPGIRSRIVEFLAGIEHFRGFKDFQKNGGINPLLDQSQLSIYDERMNRNQTIKITFTEQ